MALKNQGKRFYRHEALMRYARILGFGEIHEKIDNKTGLHAIIAIHSTKLGPAIGGSRFFRYHAAGAGLKDALRLSYMMTLKAAVSNLPHGGAKAVIIKPYEIKDRKALFEAYGDFVHEMNGRYIAAIDVGTSTEDMDIIAQRTPYVIGATKLGKADSDPSLHTALGVLHSIEAAVKFQMDKDNLEDVRIAIQGAGSVGYHLTKLLSERGAEITISDPKRGAIQRCIDEFGIKGVDINEIYDVPCDIFAPCAMGGTINTDTIKRLQCNMIVGSANNQLSHRRISEILEEKGILYAPDFVVNSGGLINAAMVYDYQDPSIADAQIAKLYDTMLNLFERSKREYKSTTIIAEQVAREKLGMTTRKEKIVVE